jgi:hypothetical protein
MPMPWEMDWTGVRIENSTPTQNKGRLSVQDNKFLNEVRATSQAGIDARNEYMRAAGAIDRFGTGPWKARLYDAAIPQENGGFFDALGAAVIGGPARLLGGVTPQGVDDFQTLKGLQSERVLSTQIAQKGPQTESDAARMQLTEISPYKTPEANRRVINSGIRKAALGAAKADFFTKWATQYGLNGLDDKGQTVDARWAQASKRALTVQPRLPGRANAGGANAGGARVVDFNDLP